jgi:Uma2 family endonuclease
MNILTEKIRFTSHDLELLPENEGTKYQIIDGELYMTRAPHWNHQRTCFKICRELENYSDGLGEASITAGVLFSETDNVIPDVVWISNERLHLLLDESGHLTGTPELIVEVLSSGKTNEDRDKEAKLKLYASRGVEEYWIADWRLQQVEVYRRENTTLKLIATLFKDDILTTPILPKFNSVVSKFF